MKAKKFGVIRPEAEVEVEIVKPSDWVRLFFLRLYVFAKCVRIYELDIMIGDKKVDTWFRLVLPKITLKQVDAL